MTTSVRTMPLRVPIRDGEALDSWLEHLARRNGMSTRRLLPPLGLSTDLRARVLVAGTPPDTLRRVESQCGQPPRRLDIAVLEHYADTGWPSLSGSRYCPACLDSNGGHWPIQWRLPWVFACTRHHTLLVGRCSGCGRPPRRHLASGAGLHPPGSCPNRIKRGQLCRAPLTDASVTTLTGDDPLLRTQHWIDARLDAIDAGLTDATRELADLHHLADWIRGFAGWRRRTALALGHGEPGQPDDEGRTRLPTISAREAGAVAVRALNLLTAESDQALLEELRLLFTQSRRDQRRGLGIGPANAWTTLPRAHTVRLLRVAAPHMAPLERLRWRIFSDEPRPPEHGTAADDRARHVPQLLWPEWLIRLQPPAGFFADEFRAAISRCLLVPGRVERNYAEIAAELHPHQRLLATHTLGHLLRGGHDTVLAAICRLADYLDRNESPIDYRRRRQLVTPDLLTAAEWTHLCAQAVAHPGQPRRLLDARRYLFSLLTGADLNDPCNTIAFQSPADRSRHLAFTLSLNAALRTALHAHATDHLRHLGIDEPLTWSPPLNCCAGLQLPGADPDDIDLHAVRELAHEHGHTPRAIAERLGTTIEHIRYAFGKIDGKPSTEPGWVRQQQADATLTREFFQREYVTAGKRLRQLQAEPGFYRRTLARHAKRADITLATGRERASIDSAWLEEQYLHRRRSFTDIGAELGMDAQTVAREACRHGITPRPAGIASHPDLITAHDELAPDIRRAVEGQLRGWQRLRRFQQAVAHPTLGAASRATGAELTALVTQFQRLERDIGGQLFYRAKRSQPMQLTERGTALTAELQRPHVQALMEKHGQPPRGKRRTDEKAGGDEPMRNPVPDDEQRHAR